MEESDVLRIKITAADSLDTKPLVADRGILTGWSLCVRGLPLGATVWDLSNLVIEGQAVERSTVVAWLNLIYKMVTAKDFESQEPNAAHTVRGMGQLLAFADAVGSSRGLLLALDSQAGAKVFKAGVQLGEAAVALTFTSEFYYGFVMPSPSTVRLMKYNASGGTSLSYHEVEGSSMAECRQQLALEMEVLLFHAFKQQLPRLANIARSFVKQNS